MFERLTSYVLLPHDICLVGEGVPLQRTSLFIVDESPDSPSVIVRRQKL